MKWFFVLVIVAGHGDDWAVDVTPAIVPQITTRTFATLAECERERQGWHYLLKNNVAKFPATTNCMPIMHLSSTCSSFGEGSPSRISFSESQDFQKGRDAIRQSASPAAMERHRTPATTNPVPAFSCARSARRSSPRPCDVPWIFRDPSDSFPSEVVLQRIEQYQPEATESGMNRDPES